MVLGDKTGSERVPKETAQRLSRRRNRRIQFRVIIGCLIVSSVSLALLAILMAQVFTVRANLLRALESAPVLARELMSGDHEAAQQSLTEISEEVESARSISTGPLWSAVAAIPFIGPNFRAVTEVAVSADDLTKYTVAPLADEYGALRWDSLLMSNGEVDVERLERVGPAIATASETVRQSYERLDSIDLESLLPNVAQPIEGATRQLGDVSRAMEPVSAAVQLAPRMLGADSPKSYLVLIQNNAEARATGGIPGALTILQTDRGRIALGRQASAGDLGVFTPPLTVSEEQEHLFSSRLGRHMQNVNLTPDFPTAASTAKRMWEEQHPDQSIDGVLALDPVVLSHLLQATGPIELTDPVVVDLVAGTNLPSSLTSENVVPTLLSDVYREIEEPALQDVYFAAVASEIFEGFTSGHGDVSRLLNALSRSSDEERIFLWSAHEPEQKIISQTPMAGAVTGSSTGGAVFGMYFNDGTGAKMDFHAHRTVQLVQGCRADGYGEYTLRVSVTNNAPPDARDSLPLYVTGGGAFGVEPGHIRTNYVAYGPAQSLVQAARLNDRLIPFASGLHGQRPVGTVSIDLAPGESAELEFIFFKVVQDTEPKLSVTPTVDPVSEVVLPLRKESGCG